MQRFKFSTLTLTIILLAFSSTINAQFSFKPKRANLVINFSPETGWELTNTLKNKTYATLNDKNINIEIINNRLRIYKMSSGLWNTHPSSKYLEMINIPYTEIPIDTGSNWFDPYCSLWVSSEGGHIRIFKFHESVSVPINHKKNVTYTNKYIENHLFLNQRHHAEITSVNTSFMVSPEGNIFEVDKTNGTWRLILKNRTLTAWSSDQPTEKMIFNIFKKEDFKNVIPIGTKDNKYYYQIIDHHNRMGIAFLSTDYFQVSIEVPPLFSFISPSININYYLIYDKKQLGILHFLPQENEDEIPVFKTAFYPNTKKLYADIRTKKPGVMKANGQPIKILLESAENTYANLHTSINFGLEIIDSDLLLYTEYDDQKNIHYSGLFKTSQNYWFIRPENSLLVNYPSSILEFEESSRDKPFKYSVSTPTGYFDAEGISELNSPDFFMITSLILEYPIDSLAAIPEYDSFTFKFLSEKKWGLVHIENENMQVLLPPKYDWIQHFGFQKSLLLTNNYQLGWYGIDYCGETNTAKLVEQHASKLELFPGNSATQKLSCNTVNSSYHSAEYFGEYLVFNSRTPNLNSQIKTAWVQEGFKTTPIIKGHHISVINQHINVISNNKMQLFSKKLKHIELDIYDSVLVNNIHVIMYNKKETLEIINQNGEPIIRPKLVAAFYQNKPIKSLQKYSTKYYNGKYFMVEKGGNWFVLQPDGKPISKTVFSSFSQAITFENTLLK